MPVLFDSSIYIAALQLGGDASLPLQRRTRESPIWLSSVVLEELYAGAEPGDSRIIERLEHDFERARRMLVPNLSDWTHAGKILARIAKKYGYEQIGRARMIDDALIATSAARTGLTVITVNQRDFARLAEFCPFRWEIRRISAG